MPCPDSYTHGPGTRDFGELFQEKARARALADYACCISWSPGCKVFSIPMVGRPQAPRDDSCKLLILQMRRTQGATSTETGLRSKAKCTLTRPALSLGSCRGRRRGCDPEKDPSGAADHVSAAAGPGPDTHETCAAGCGSLARLGGEAISVSEGGPALRPYSELRPPRGVWG